MSAWWVTKISRSTVGAAPTSATFSISSATIPNARTIRLEQNYRSTKNILEAASALVANNKERKGKWLWTDSGAGELLGLYSGFDAENEALFIADTIERLLAENPARARGGALPHEFSIAPDRRSAAALRTQIHRGGRIQLLSTR